jgi:hypothetical protein
MRRILNAGLVAVLAIAAVFAFTGPAAADDVTTNVKIIVTPMLTLVPDATAIELGIVTDTAYRTGGGDLVVGLIVAANVTVKSAQLNAWPAKVTTTSLITEVTFPKLAADSATYPATLDIKVVVTPY